MSVTEPILDSILSQTSWQSSVPYLQESIQAWFNETVKYLYKEKINFSHPGKSLCIRNKYTSRSATFAQLQRMYLENVWIPTGPMIYHSYHSNKIGTLKRPVSKPSTSCLGLEKCRLGGMSPCSMAVTTFVMEHSPDVASACPMLDLTDPIKSGVCLPLQKTWSNAANSTGSPTCIQLQCYIN